jgi:DNA-directed RNA polymerase specialized sigma24 family protein
MERQIIEVTNTFLSPEERTRLVRLCARITGHSEVAEDLAQETLLEAWKYQHALRDREKRSQWLSGIDHCLCLR